MLASVLLRAVGLTGVGSTGGHEWSTLRGHSRAPPPDGDLMIFLSVIMQRKIKRKRQEFCTIRYHSPPPIHLSISPFLSSLSISMHAFVALYFCFISSSLLLRSFNLSSSFTCRRHLFHSTPKFEFNSRVSNSSQQFSLFLFSFLYSIACHMVQALNCSFFYYLCIIITQRQYFCESE